MRKLMRQANAQNGRGLLFEEERNILNVQPIIMDGSATETMVWFTSDFTEYSIYKLIQDIEQIKQGDYKKMKLYFSSNGGCIFSLRVLADYLNKQIGDLEIDLYVTGLVASAGFYILLMIENSNIKIMFDNLSMGLIHLSDSLVSQRSMLSREDARYSAEQHFIKSTTTVNNWLTTEYLDKLDLREKDREMLQQGKDVMLEQKELERVVNKFREERFLESDECQEEIGDLMVLYTEINERIKFLTGKTIEEFMKEFCFDDKAIEEIETEDEEIDN